MPSFRSWHRRSFGPRHDWRHHPFARIPKNMLTVTPIDIAEANAFVSSHHRHHKPVRGAKFAIAVSDQSSTVRGVAIVGRPVARMIDDGWTLEVNRCCTDGARNACSMLYGAAWRAAKALGYRRLVTYTLPEEGGSSLRAAGWRLLGKAGGGSWNRACRPRVDAAPTQQKLAWEAGCGPIVELLDSGRHANQQANLVSSKIPSNAKEQCCTTSDDYSFVRTSILTGPMLSPRLLPLEFAQQPD